MRWKRIIEEYFRKNKRGNVEDIKIWLEQNYLHLFKEEVENFVYKNKLGRLNWNITSHARKQIYSSEYISKLLDVWYREGKIDREENFKGQCKWVYFIAPNQNSASQVSKADEHNISLKESALADSQISSNDETSLNNNIKLQSKKQSEGN